MPHKLWKINDDNRVSPEHVSSFLLKGQELDEPSEEYNVSKGNAVDGYCL